MKLDSTYILYNFQAQYNCLTMDSGDQSYVHNVHIHSNGGLMKILLLDIECRDLMGQNFQEE